MTYIEEIEKQNAELQEKLAEAEAQIESVKNLYIRMEPTEGKNGETTAYALMVGRVKIGCIYMQYNQSKRWFGRVDLGEGIDLGVYFCHYAASGVMHELVKRLS